MEVFALAPFSPPGLYSGLGTQTTAKGAEDAELGPPPSSEGSWCVSLCPDFLVPLSPCCQDRRKELKPIPSQPGNALLERVETDALGECLSQFPSRTVRFGAPRGSFPSLHSSLPQLVEGK